MNNPEQCRFWTNVTQWLFVVQMGVMVITLILLSTAKNAVAMSAMEACWVSAILLHVANLRLTRTGFQHQRYQYTHSLLNHADIRLRLLFHILINWGVILLTTGVAWFISDQDMANARILARVVVIASLLVLISFNLQHKKVNRVKNILFTSVLAVTLTLLVFPLL